MGDRDDRQVRFEVSVQTAHYGRQLTDWSEMAGQTILRLTWDGIGIYGFQFQDSWAVIRPAIANSKVSWDDTYRPDETDEVWGYDIFGAIAGKTVLKAEYAVYVNEHNGRSIRHLAIYFTDGGLAWITPIERPQSDLTMA